MRERVLTLPRQNRRIYKESIAVVSTFWKMFSRRKNRLKSFVFVKRYIFVMKTRKIPHYLSILRIQVTVFITRTVLWTLSRKFGYNRSLHGVLRSLNIIRAVLGGRRTYESLFLIATGIRYGKNKNAFRFPRTTWRYRRTLGAKVPNDRKTDDRAWRERGK